MSRGHFLSQEVASRRVEVGGEGSALAVAEEATEQATEDVAGPTGAARRAGATTEHLAQDVLQRAAAARCRARRGRAARGLDRSAVGAHATGEERAGVRGARWGTGIGA